MPDEEYHAQLARLRKEWGSVSVVPDMPGFLRATNDPSTGIMIGMRAPLFAEIINRALETE